MKNVVLAFIVLLTLGCNDIVAQKPELILSTSSDLFSISVQWHPTKKMFVTSGEKLQLWHVEKGLLRNFRMDVKSSNIALSKDGMMLAVTPAYKKDGGTRIFNTKNGSLIKIINNAKDCVPTFHPTKNWLLAKNWGDINIYDIGTGELIKTLKLVLGKGSSDHFCKVSNNGQYFGVGVIYNSNTFQPIILPNKEGYYTKDIAFHPFLPQAAVISSNGKSGKDKIIQVTIWDLSTKQRINSWVISSTNVLFTYSGAERIQYSSEGKNVIITGDNGFLGYDANTGMKKITKKLSFGMKWAFHPTQPYVLDYDKNPIKIYNTNTAQVVYDMSEVITPTSRLGWQRNDYKSGAIFNQDKIYSAEYSNLENNDNEMIGFRLWDLKNGLIRKINFEPTNYTLTSSRNKQKRALESVSGIALSNNINKIFFTTTFPSWAWSEATSNFDTRSYLNVYDNTLKRIVERNPINNHEELEGILANGMYITKNYIFNSVTKKWRVSKFDFYQYPSRNVLFSIKLFKSSDSQELIDKYYNNKYPPKSDVLAYLSKDTQFFYVKKHKIETDVYRTSDGQFINSFKGNGDKQSQLPGLIFFSNDGKFKIELPKPDGLEPIKVRDLVSNDIKVSIYPLKDNNWIATTPDGYFDGTSEGMKQLYFVSGYEKVPLDQLYEKFYTPNLIARVYNGEDVTIEGNVDISELTLSPLVKILNPVSGNSSSKQVTVSIRATDQGGGIDEIRLYHNGKLVNTTQRGFKLVGENKEFTINLVGGANELKATALNEQRTESNPDIVNVYYEGAVASSELYLLVVGINDYRNPVYSLNYALTDAQAFKQTIESGASTIFSNISTTYIKDRDASKGNIIQALQKIKQQAGPEDMFVFYYAGHGVMSEGTMGYDKDFYLVPYDVTKLYGADEMLAQKAISSKEITDISKDIPAQKQLFVLDACQSGGALQQVASRGAAEEKAIAQLARSTGTYWLTASGSEQFATEFEQLGHGVFTYAVLEGLKGNADSGDKKVTAKELGAFIEDKVPELTEQYKGTAQFPRSYGYGQDFPLVIIK